MAEDKTMDSIHRNLLKKFHTLCTVLGMTADEKASLIEAYGVESSRDIDTHSLVDICAKLSKQASDKQHKDCDKLRKQCMAAIGKWLNMTGRENNATIIKAIACRAAKYDDFNKIPKERLRNLTFLFNNKVKDGDAVEEITESKAIMLYPKENGTGTV